MINYHPNDLQLSEFVAGTLNPAWSLMVSAHVDMCPHCQDKVKQLSQNEADKQFAPVGFANASDDEQLQAMLSDIVCLPEDRAVPELKPAELELDGKKFQLPRALQRFVQHTDGWSKLVGKLWQAPVELGEGGKAHFIYMEKGGSVPEHTHRGNELTLVINGEFEDGVHCYDSGDFIQLDGHHTHTPVSHDDDGCLVFTFVDEPLHFTSGVARLLNPFSHLFFK